MTLLNSNFLNIVAQKKECMLYMKIIGNAEILSKLHLNRNAFFYEINLIICTVCFKPFCFNYSPLLCPISDPNDFPFGWNVSCNIIGRCY